RPSHGILLRPAVRRGTCIEGAFKGLERCSRRPVVPRRIALACPLTALLAGRLAPHAPALPHLPRRRGRVRRRPSLLAAPHHRARQDLARGFLALARGPLHGLLSALPFRLRRRASRAALESTSAGRDALPRELQRRTVLPAKLLERRRSRP